MIALVLKIKYFILFLDIRALASKLVEQWLKTVKGEQVVPIAMSEISKIKADAHNIVNTIKTEVCDENITENKNCIVENQVPLIVKSEPNDIKIEKESEDDEDLEKKDLLVLKISLKDGNKIVSQVDDSDSKSLKSSDADTKDHKSKSKEKSRDRSSSSKSSSSSSKHSHRSHSSSSDKHKSSHKSGSSSSSRRSSKDETKEKDKERHSSSRSKSDSKSRKSSDKSSSSSSKSKDERSSKSSSEKDRNKHKEKEDKHRDSSQKSSEKASDEKSQSPSIHKLGKIPKLSDVKKEKPSISIEVRKPDEPKPKTVKTYNSRFRKHGLEEEVKPPPSRATLLNKKTPPPALPPSVPIPKRPSPVHNETPPEKKAKILESIEKPGSIKLIPPKPKREYKSFCFCIYLNLTYFIFSGLHSSPLQLHSSTCNSLGRFYFSGKSKMCNIMGSKVILHLVKYLSLINSILNVIFPLIFPYRLLATRRDLPISPVNGHLRRLRYKKVGYEGISCSRSEFYCNLPYNRIQPIRIT